MSWRVALNGVVILAALLRFLWLDRFPPGLHYDEAAYGLQALELWAHPRIAVFFPAFTGREPLFIYLLAATTGLFGATVLTVHATSAAVGVMAVATTGLAGRALFGPLAGLTAAGLMAASFWHLMFSRQTHRLGLLAALAPLAVWAIWRTWERPTLARGLFAGVLTGALAYTYVTARLLLPALGLFVAIELFRARSRRPALALCLGVAALVAFPLGLYFLRHPEQFAVRFSQTASTSLLQGVVDTMRLYGVRGDAQQKFNLPLRPGLDPLLTALFALGVGALAWRWRDPRGSLTLLWLLGSLAAGFLTVDTPNFGRLMAAAAPSYLIVARGALALRPWVRLLPAVASVLVLVEAGLTARAYFVDWAPSTDTYYALDGDLADLGRLALAQSPGEDVYASSEHYRHPTVAFVGGASFERLRWFDGRTALVLPPPGRPARYLIPASARPPELPGRLDGDARDPSGATSVEVRALEAATDPSFTRAVGVSFAFANRPDRPAADLLGADPPSAARAGDALRVRTVWWLRTSAPEHTPDFFAHAIDADGRRWGQRDASPYLAPEWREGERIVVWLDVPIEPTAPAGPYRVRLGLNDPSAGRALEARGPDGRVLPEGVVLFEVPVAPGPRVDVPRFLSAAPGASRWTGVSTLGAATLLAATWPTVVDAGRPSFLDLYWRAESDAPRGSASVRLRRSGEDRLMGGQDLAAAGSPWGAGEARRDVHRLTPARADAGTWTLVVAVDGREQAVGQIEVRAPAMSFDLPAPQRPLAAEFQGVARLLGLDVRPEGVRLFWQPTGAAPIDYAVFVHVLGSDGRIVAQHDGQPAGGARPTRGWIADEVVADDHPLPLPEDWRALAVGLYNPADGRRVPVVGGADHVRVERR